MSNKNKKDIGKGQVLSFLLRTKKLGYYVMCSSEGHDTLLKCDNADEMIDKFTKLSREQGQLPFLADSLEDIRRLCYKYGVECKLDEDKLNVIFWGLQEDNKC